MLDDIRKSYEQCANFIPGWKDMNKNDLCNKYVELRDSPEGDYYLSAIVLKYWPKIWKMYAMSQPYATAEDCYEWVIEGVFHGLRYATWLDPENNMYGDPNAPDKIINGIIKGVRSNYFQALNRDKRKIAMKTMSYNALEEQYENIDFLLPAVTYDFVDYVEGMSTEDNLIISYFRNKDYLNAFTLDLIIYSGLTEPESIAQEIRNSDDQYSKYFSKKFNITKSLVDLGLQYERTLSKKQLTQKINDNILSLRQVLKGLKENNED